MWMYEVSIVINKNRSKMKAILKYIKGLVMIGAIISGMVVTSCEDEPDKYEISDGLPTVKYIRMTDPEVADSLITGAYMANTICLVGENLRSVYELYFNDQKAILNTSLITDNTLIVDIPSTIPSVVTNKIYLTNKNHETVTYDFNVLVPAPEITSMSNEYAQPGTVATIYGDYFIDDPNVPLSIEIGNVPVTEITDLTRNAVSFVIPDGAEWDTLMWNLFMEPDSLLSVIWSVMVFCSTLMMMAMML